MTRDELIEAIEGAKVRRLVALLSDDSLTASLLELRIAGLERRLAEIDAKRP